MDEEDETVKEWELGMRAAGLGVFHGSERVFH